MFFYNDLTQNTWKIPLDWYYFIFQVIFKKWKKNTLTKVNIFVNNRKK
jgi:hypothetical protein